MLQAYNERLTPLAMAFAGMGEPFSTPTLELAQTMFDLAYPDHNYRVREDDVFFSLVSTPPLSPISCGASSSDTLSF